MIVFLRTLLDYVFNGSDVLFVQLDRQQLQEYEAYTERENLSGFVSKDTAWFKRDEFWRSREKPKLRIVRAGER